MGVVQVLAHPTRAQVRANPIVYMEPPPNHDGGQYASAPLVGTHGWLLYCHLLGVGSPT
jgi:hypothetical protein